MKNLIYLSGIFLLLIISCNKNDEYNINTELENLIKNNPICIVEKIKSIYLSNSQIRNTLYKYNYKGEIVYVIDSEIAKGVGSFSVFNSNCERICGGDSGVVYNNTCIDWNTATLIEIVWKDQR